MESNETTLAPSSMKVIEIAQNETVKVGNVCGKIATKRIERSEGMKSKWKREKGKKNNNEN